MKWEGVKKDGCTIYFISPLQNTIIRVSVLNLNTRKKLSYTLTQGHRAYFIQMKDSGQRFEHQLHTSDAAKITKELQIDLEAIENSHYLLLDMKNSSY